MFHFSRSSSPTASPPRAASASPPPFEMSPESLPFAPPSYSSGVPLSSSGSESEDRAHGARGGWARRRRRKRGGSSGGAGSEGGTDMPFVPLSSQSVGNVRGASIIGSQNSGTDGTLFQFYSCGSGTYGKLGLGGDERALSEPAEMGPHAFGSHRRGAATGLGCGRSHTLCCLDDGSAYAWGRNQHGQLGIGAQWRSQARQGEPIPLDCDDGGERSEGAEECEYVSVPTPIVFQIEMEEGEGDGEVGAPKSASGGPSSAWGAAHVVGKIHVVGVTCGTHHSLLTTSHGHTYSWGRGSQNGATGHGHDRDLDHPVLIEGLVSNVVVGTAAGYDHSLALTIEGEVYSWGRDEEGQLGAGWGVLGTVRDGQGRSRDRCRRVPGRVLGDLQGRPVAMLACSQGGHGSYAVTAEDGYVWRWGSMDEQHSYGDHPHDTFALPTPLPAPLGAPPASDLRQHSRPPPHRHHVVAAISAGRRHLVVVTRGGEAYAMGAPGPHLGIGPGCAHTWLDHAGRVLLPGDVLADGVACGEEHTFLTTTSGGVWACGVASFGRLGIKGERDLSAASCPVGAVPRPVSLWPEKKLKGFGGHKKGSRSTAEETGAIILSSDGESGEPICSATIGPFTVASEAIHKRIGSRIDAFYIDNEGNVDEGADPSSSEDKGDISSEWGDVGTNEDMEGYKNVDEMFDGADQQHRDCTSSYGSWKIGLRCGTAAVRGAISNSAKLAGSVLTGSAKLNGAVMSVVGSARESVGVLAVREPCSLPGGTMVGEAHNSGAVCNGGVLSSFGGLTGDARRRIVLACGSSHSCIHMADDLK
mmetsp:Transcript_17771/g.35491  ORF Transcript_17771/g.35491 Transcript_17771/m.35491 type:complete len:811 (+) Transcript_17771:167-2599(+)